MNTNANPSGDESLSGPAAEALLAYLRRKDDTGNSDVSEFVKESPQFAAYEDILRSHAEAASLLGGANGPLPNCGETVTFDALRHSGDDTTPPTAHSDAGDRPELPEEIAFTTHVREIARHAEGGLGVVCRGEDALLNREVAIKFIRPEREEDVAARETFMLEAEITGRLDHPGVAPVHGIGETESGRRFYVMRYMPGESLADRPFPQADVTQRSTSKRHISRNGIVGNEARQTWRH